MCAGSLLVLRKDKRKGAKWCCLGSGDLIIYVVNNIWEFDKCRIDSLDEHFDMQDDVWMEWYLLWVDGMIKAHLLHPNFQCLARACSRAQKKREVSCCLQHARVEGASAAPKRAASSTTLLFFFHARNSFSLSSSSLSFFFPLSFFFFSLLLFPLFFLSPLFFFFSCFCALRANIFRMTILLAHSKGLEKAFQMI